MNVYAAKPERFKPIQPHRAGGRRASAVSPAERLITFKPFGYNNLPYLWISQCVIIFLPKVLT